MTSLTSYVSSDYQKASNYLAPKSAPKKILVYVEGVEDVSFWHNILSRHEKSVKIKFDIQPYSNSELANGKKSLERLFQNTGDYLIICLDSDYDYLLPDNSDMSREISRNPCIFQTYTYSIENLKCYAESIFNICVKVTHNTTEKINFPELLIQYSKIVYELFIWNLYFYNVGDFNTFTIDNFCSIIKITENPIIDEHGKTALENLAARINLKSQELQEQFPQHESDIALFADQLKEYGLTNENSYLFIQGHTIYDNVVSMFIKSICNELKKERIAEIKNSLTDENVKNHKTNEYIKSVGRINDTVETVLFNNDKFEECFLFKKIEDDINAYLKACSFYEV
jgi:hypothetical protein